MAACCVFPAETVCNILKYSDPQDIVRWRAVSRWFCDITYDDSIWRELYAESCLPRPPGPFPSQSTTYLEQALVRTEKLARSWTTGPMRVVSRLELRAERKHSCDIFNEGWLVGCEQRKCFVLYDVVTSVRTSTPQKQVIWRQREMMEIGEWSVASITTEGGLFMLYVLFGETHVQLDILPAWKLLEVRLNSAGNPCNMILLDVPEFPRDWDTVLRGGKSPFLCIWGKDLWFDTRTHIFYELPDFCIALDETRRKIDADVLDGCEDFIILTRTHIIAVHECPPSTTLIQAFTIGESSVRNGRCVLRLTHEGVLNYLCQDVTLLRNSIVDPITGSTNMRLLNIEVDQHSILLSDLTLPMPTGDNVLPITVVTDEKTTHGLRLERSHYYLDCSDAGHLRGFFMKPHSSQGNPNTYIVKFVVDATGDNLDECTLALGEPLPLEGKDTDSRMSEFDGARGRLYIFVSYGADEVVMAIADIE